MALNRLLERLFADTASVYDIPFTIIRHLPDSGIVRLYCMGGDIGMS